MEQEDEKRVMMATQTLFKWRHFEAEIILLCVRWYLRYALSYRDLEEIMAERGHAARPSNDLSLGTTLCS
jgi:transposase-like protein